MSKLTFVPVTAQKLSAELNAAIAALRLLQGSTPIIPQSNTCMGSLTFAIATRNKFSAEILYQAATILAYEAQVELDDTVDPVNYFLVVGSKKASSLRSIPNGDQHRVVGH